MKNFYLSLFILALATLACNGGATPNIPPTPQNSAFKSNETAYGFYPSPPEITLESVFATFKGISEHGDFVLIQQNTDWESFAKGIDGESKTRTDIINQLTLASQNNLDHVFVIDALNGLNRREFANLPTGWDANFANPEIRTAHKNFAVWVVRNFHPRYLGLASEINTYMDAHPEDAQNFISLYNEIYALVKAEAPETQVFVTFQWDDLNNMFPQPEEGNRQKFDINWEQIESFEPNLDIWAISTYPYFVFPSGEEIPVDYYTPLLSHTSKLVAVAEGGFSSEAFAQFTNTPKDQVAYLNAIHTQLGPRLTFWVNTLLSDLNIASYAKEIGNPEDSSMLGNFAYIGFQNFDGSPKPALELWDSFQEK